MLSSSYVKVCAPKDSAGEASGWPKTNWAVWKKAAKKPQLLRWTEIKEEKLNDKITRKLAVGQNEMIGRLWLAKGAVVPPHKHVSEQITMVMSGAIKFTIGRKDITVRGEEVLVIPPNVVHSAIALEDTDDIDSFSPLHRPE
jgi:quercetin dioxygenase-like cupin family protein